jgi:hypothetical protein
VRRQADRRNIADKVGGPEYRQVLPLRYLEHDRLGSTFRHKISIQLGPQQASLGADDAVIAGAITRMTMEDVDADLLLRGLFGCIP